MFDAQGGLCHWCKQSMTLDSARRMTPSGKMKNVATFATFDHVQRRRDGGRWSKSNIVLACYSCNQLREKGKKTHQKGGDNPPWHASMTQG